MATAAAGAYYATAAAVLPPDAHTETKLLSFSFLTVSPKFSLYPVGILIDGKKISARQMRVGYVSKTFKKRFGKFSD